MWGPSHDAAIAVSDLRVGVAWSKIVESIINTIVGLIGIAVYIGGGLLFFAWMIYAIVTCTHAAYRDAKEKGGNASALIFLGVLAFSGPLVSCMFRIFTGHGLKGTYL